MEPEPEPELEEDTEKLDEVVLPELLTATPSRSDTAKSMQERVKEQSDTIKRLSMTLRPKEMGVYLSCIVGEIHGNIDLVLALVATQI